MPGADQGLPDVACPASAEGRVEVCSRGRCDGLIGITTSTNEKELPDAFLRRCFFHYIKFPDQETMTKIVNVHFPELKKNLLNRSLIKMKIL